MHSGWLRPVQSFHYWGSSVLILGSFLGLLTLILFRGRRSEVLATAGLLGFSLLLQITGNALPNDAHGVKSAAVEIGISKRFPGPNLFPADFGSSLGGPDLALWTRNHQFVFAAGFLLCLIALTALHIRQARSWVSLAGAALVAVVSALMASPFGSEPVGALADGSAMVSWYTAPMHGALVMFGKISPSLSSFGALWFPTLTGLLVVGFVVLGPKAKPMMARWAVAVYLLLAVLLPLAFVERVAPLTGKRDPIVARSAGGTVAPVDAALAAEGKRRFNALPCVGCHGKDGLENLGGPSLATVHQRHPDSEFYMKYIKNPQLVNPSSTMPPFPAVSDADRRAIAEYLRQPRP